jgi:hypothetical protein
MCALRVHPSFITSTEVFTIRSCTYDVAVVNALICDKNTIEGAPTTIFECLEPSLEKSTIIDSYLKNCPVATADTEEGNHL